MLAATALGLAVVAGTHDPTHVLEGLTCGDLAALDDARVYVCQLQITDDATRQAAASLLDAAAEQLQTPPARAAQGHRPPRPHHIGKIGGTAEAVSA
jgi:hypothetical protein